MLPCVPGCGVAVGVVGNPVSEQVRVGSSGPPPIIVNPRCAGLRVGPKSMPSRLAGRDAAFYEIHIRRVSPVLSVVLEFVFEAGFIARNIFALCQHVRVGGDKRFDLRQ